MGRCEGKCEGSDLHALRHDPAKIHPLKPLSNAMTDHFPSYLAFSRKAKIGEKIKARDILVVQLK